MTPIPAPPDRPDTSQQIALFDALWREAERRRRLNRSHPLPVWQHFAAILRDCGLRLVVVR